MRQGRIEHSVARDPSREYWIVALVSRKRDEAIVQWYADLVGGRRDFRVRMVREDSRAAGGAIERLRELARGGSLGFLIAPLTAEGPRVKELFEFVTEVDVPALFVRPVPGRRIRRVLVASAGGPHTLQQLWIAREIGGALNVPVSGIRLVGAEDHTDVLWSSPPAGDALVENWTPRILGVKGEDRRLISDHFAQGIAACVRPGDLLVMGAPSSLYAGRIGESMPALVARQTKAPFIVMKSKRAESVTLRGLLWGRLVLPDLRPASKEAAIAALVEALVRHNQAPRACKENLVRRALRRERVASTAVGCETAFPHVRLPGFHGVAVSLAICPEGVDFGGDDGRRTKFVYLVISSEGFCDEHLAVVARIARRMVRDEVRQALLGCATPSEALDVLEPRLVAVGVGGGVA
ncbi:MAG: PTS system mannose-specific EIIBCA component [Verrucomicrobia bacterium ADurb.Bin345]|nr:MAG: PTS system mannose-specific EIIBCA component [Verrucomicrobia bacterium ADurb.Bin345]